MAITMAHCSQPNCVSNPQAVLDDEGYCAVCGAQGSGAPAPASQNVAPGASGPSLGLSRSVSASRTSARLANATFAPPTTTQGSRSSSPSSSVKTRSTSSTSRGTTLGAGYISLPPLPPQDVEHLVTSGEIPADKRPYCSKCGGVPADNPSAKPMPLSYDHGFCPLCGEPYDFRPTLKRGDVVADKYEVAGPAAYGGFGWIYIARDRLLNRWAVMKGVLNAGDADAIEQAVREREFLGQVKHRSIVTVYDFLTVAPGYIVMEFVNGKTLATLRKEYGGPLPPAEAVAYILELLPGFQYMHERGMVYCDFKPENAMVEGDTVKLIDLGGVIRADDTTSAVYSTPGYAAPEADEQPTPLSDIYSIGRTLARLVADFDMFHQYEHGLPPAEQIPVFNDHESLYLFLRKATTADPAARFQSVDEMADQLRGVLRDIVSVSSTGPLPRLTSTVFDDAGQALADHPAGGTMLWQELPLVRLNAADPGAGILLGASAVVDHERRLELFTQALKQFSDSVDLQMRAALEMLYLGSHEKLHQTLDELARREPQLAWMARWYQGLAHLAVGRGGDATGMFDTVYAELPGEVAPKLALGMAAEARGELDEAIYYLEQAALADRDLPAAAIGLGRCWERRGERAKAVAAYQRVPASSSRYPAAQVCVVRALINASHGSPTAADLAAASNALEGLNGHVDSLQFHRLSAELLQAALDFVRAGSARTGGTAVLGAPLQERAVRAKLEQELRACASLVTDHAEKIQLVDEANRLRPRTLV